MSYALLWVFSLAAALLAFAALSSFTNQARGRRIALILLLLATLGPALLLAGVALAMRARQVSPDWLVYTLSWVVAYIAGAVRLWRRPPEAGSWVRLAGAALAALGLLVLTFDLTLAAIERQLAATAAAHRAVAMTLMGEPVADRENAAVVDREAFEHLDALAPGLPDWFKQYGAPYGSQGQGKEKPEDVARVLEASKPVLAILRRGAAMPRWHWADFDLAQPMASTIPPLLAYRRSANLLASDARQRAAQGDTAGAAADIVAIWRISRHLTAGHTIIEHLIAVALLGTGTDALESCLATTSAWRTEDLALLAAEAPISLQPSLERTWRMEASTMMVTMASIGLEPSTDQDLLGGEALLPRLGGVDTLFKVFMLREDLETYPRVMRKPFDLYRRPAYETVKERAQLAEEFEHERKGLLTAIAVPSLLRVAASTYAADARGRLARLALAVTAYEARNKRPPANTARVPDVIESIPVDPFAPAPVKMLQADGGLVLYSVGGDMKDDGGAREQGHEGDQKGDITFCLGQAYTARKMKR